MYNNLAQIYQITNNNINYLLAAMGIIVGALTFITSVVIAFFTIKHLRVDKEIQQYRDNVKQQSELAINDFLSIKIKLDDELKEIHKETEDLEKMKASLQIKGERTDKDFVQIEKKIEKIKSKINFTEGQISAMPTIIDTQPFRVFDSNNFINLDKSSVFHCGSDSSAGIKTIKCDKCNKDILENTLWCQYCGTFNSKNK